MRIFTFIYVKNKKNENKSYEHKVMFRHRFMKAHKLSESVKRTLEILENYNRDLIEFMVRISELESGVSILRKLACGLYLLTYDELSVEKINEMLENEDKFEKYCERKRKNLWHKRLWAALRDYLKGSIAECIRKHIESKYGSGVKIMQLWENPQEHLTELELPGDVWNQKFYERVILHLANNIGIKVSKESSKGIRRLYKYLRNYSENFTNQGLYLEQFDVTFDFARIFCDRELCPICPLYESGREIEKLCVGDFGGEKEKYCPVLAMLGYLRMCYPHECPIKLGNVPRVCKGYGST